jgi:gamma-glutamylcyclotransferase (GGCT)/AIG2-like uncharacterized protein YtfP
MEFKIPSLICVYGTLRRGHGNHRILENSEFLGEFRTENGYTMISLGGFPGLLLDGKDSIVCEVFKVDNKSTAQRLDMLEGYPNFYNRTQIDTPWGKAWVYYLEHNEYKLSRYPIIEEGDWNKIQKNGRF